MKVLVNVRVTTEPCRVLVRTKNVVIESARCGDGVTTIVSLSFQRIRFSR